MAITRHRTRSLLQIAAVLALAAGLGTPMIGLGAVPSASPSPSGSAPATPPPGATPTLEIAVTALASIAHLGEPYPVSVTVTNVSTEAITTTVEVGYPGHLDLVSVCTEDNVRIEPGTTFALPCDLPIHDYVSCDITWYWFGAIGRTDGGVWAETNADTVSVAIDIEEVPATCPADPEPGVAADAADPGAPISGVGGSSSGSVEFENTGNITLQVTGIYLDSDTTEAVRGFCEVNTLLRPGEAGEAGLDACRYDMSGAADCDVVLRPTGASTFSTASFYSGEVEVVPATGPAVLVDIAGVGACRAGSPGPAAGDPTPPPTDASIETVGRDRDDLVPAVLLSALAGLAALAIAAARRGRGAGRTR